jgi:hypothetical protein
MKPEFVEFPKIARLNRAVVITEKIDGTNGCVFVDEDGSAHAGSRTRWITPEDDNFGFAAWVRDHAEELRGLGAGLHYGEWWGSGIQRRYGLDHKRFSLFNVGRWTAETPPPACCRVVPIVGAYDVFSTAMVAADVEFLRRNGSLAADGFPKPEGVCVFHLASRTYLKVTLEKDEEPKSAALWREKQKEAAR